VRAVVFWGLAALLGTGRSHVLSSAVRQQIDTTLSLTQLRTTPEAYKDGIMMLSGDILNTRNLTEGTFLEVLQKSLDAIDRPLDTDRPEGASWRFARGTSTLRSIAKDARGHGLGVSWAQVQTRLGRWRTSIPYLPAGRSISGPMWPDC
jgi:hypothetical protein